MAYGDSFKDEDGNILYVGMANGYNFIITPVKRADNSWGDYMVYFLNGGFRNGEKVKVGKADTIARAYDMADAFDARLP